GYEYARTQNPTRAALEANVAAIEGGRAAYAFASGMAAIGAITSALRAGESSCWLSLLISSSAFL
ncbi:MAG: PLP-dependent transferase, partial [Chthoniobacterales bacterium]